MKKLILFFAAFIITAFAFAQAPNQFNYQTVIRNNNGALVTNQSVGFRFTISHSSTPVYVETQTATTNMNGLASLSIGGGTPTTGTFAGIDWASGPYTITTEVDLNNTGTYSIIGTSSLLSVPYALYAGNSAPVGFYAENDSQLVITSETVFPFTQVRYNNGGGYNPNTGTFTAPVAGNYHMDLSLQFPGEPNQYPIYIDVYVNGNYTKRFVHMIPSLLNYGFTVSQTYDLSMAAGNTLQIQVVQNFGPSLTIPDNGGGNDSFWSVNKY